MSRFARVGQNAVFRNAEIAGEELRLFIIILFHSWIPPHVCEFTLRQLCEGYGLNYDHSCARFKELRRKGWCEKVGKYPRPLVGMPNEKTSEIEVFDEITSKTEVLKAEKLQKLKSITSKTEVNNGQKLQKRKFFQSHIRNIDLKQDCLDTTTDKPDVVVVGKTNGHKSQFSIEDIRRYVELCELEGQAVKNRHGLETYLFESGEKDALIYAKLYPEQPEQFEQSAEPSYSRNEALVMLTDMLAEGLPISGMKQFFPDDWTWLQEQLNDDEQRQG